jgi:hypothetical protein
MVETLSGIIDPPRRRLHASKAEITAQTRVGIHTPGQRQGRRQTVTRQTASMLAGKSSAIPDNVTSRMIQGPAGDRRHIPLVPQAIDLASPPPPQGGPAEALGVSGAAGPRPAAPGLGVRPGR